MAIAVPALADATADGTADVADVVADVANVAVPIEGGVWQPGGVPPFGEPFSLSGVCWRSIWRCGI